MDKLKVKAANGRMVPVEGDFRNFYSSEIATEVENSQYIRRRIGEGSLIIVSDEVKKNTKGASNGE